MTPATYRTTTSDVGMVAAIPGGGYRPGAMPAPQPPPRVPYVPPPVQPMPPPDPAAMRRAREDAKARLLWDQIFNHGDPSPSVPRLIVEDDVALPPMKSPQADPEPEDDEAARRANARRVALKLLSPGADDDDGDAW